ncbi:uncharacterized protein LOC127565700 [Drosophila albomicans]|uniref:Uncharacterized protein LOC127565700 n=1 Tax=Drosophila albomicans TaxID=7291 RepID=A0A9C6WBF1_DROAB|nr:uncharacterized protein LOC127565700 [Drosophila albomicans]
MRSGRVSDSQMGGVANGGHLLGLIAFARKIARVLLSLSLLCCILFLSFYLGNSYDVHNGQATASDHPHSAASATTATDMSLVNSTLRNTSSTTINNNSIAINSSASAVNSHHSPETYSI